jgi:hypothetical protein
MSPGQRRTLVLAAVVLVAGAAATGFALWPRRQSRSEFRREVDALMRQVSDGQAAAVYEAAAPRFRDALLRERFVDMAQAIRQTLGPYQGVVEVRSASRHRGRTALTARVITTLAFAAGRTRGAFSFQHLQGRWQLLGMTVDIPEPLVQQARRATLAREPTAAPAEVLALVPGLLATLRDGNLEEVYAAASPLFKQSVELETFRELLAGRKRVLGGFRRVLDITSSSLNPSRTQARIYAALEYEHAKTTGTFEFILAPTGWQLLAFKISVPEPLLPEDRSP